MKTIDKIKLAFKLPIQKFYSLKYKVPNVINDVQTLDYIFDKKCSVCRYGDGELYLMCNLDIRFQKHSKMLRQRLIEIAKSEDENVLVCAPDVFGLVLRNSKDLAKASQNGEDIPSIDWKKKLFFTLGYWSKYFQNSFYGDAGITRFYFRLKGKDSLPDYVNKLKMLWEKRDIVFVEGEHSKLGINNDLYDNAKSIKRILCPSKNAYEKYDEILAAVIQNVDKDSLIIAALGPTATVLCYDLAKMGYQALDLGHIDIEYEWFLAKAEEKIQIPGKAVNEVKNGYEDLDGLKVDEAQIITKISY